MQRLEGKRQLRALDQQSTRQTMRALAQRYNANGFCPGNVARLRSAQS